MATNIDYNLMLYLDWKDSRGDGRGLGFGSSYYLPMARGYARLKASGNLSDEEISHAISKVHDSNKMLKCVYRGYTKHMDGCFVYIFINGHHGCSLPFLPVEIQIDKVHD